MYVRAATAKGNYTGLFQEIDYYIYLLIYLGLRVVGVLFFFFLLSYAT